jgi:hypothetical protein
MEDKIGGKRGSDEGDEKCMQNPVVNSEGKRPFGRTERRWKDTVKLNKRYVYAEDQMKEPTHSVTAQMVTTSVCNLHSLLKIRDRFLQSVETQVRIWWRLLWNSNKLSDSGNSLQAFFLSAERLFSVYTRFIYT